MSQFQEIKQFWPSQREMFNWGPTPCMLLGGVGCGKTTIGILKMLYLLDQYPGSRGAIVRQRFQQLKKTVATTLWKMLPKDRIERLNHNEGFLYLTNGSRLDLIHLDKADSLTNLKSLDLNFAYVDQCEDISAEAWDTLWERLGRWSGANMRGGWPKDWPHKTRMGDCIPPRYLFGGCYSPGFDHWITARFWEHGSERERYAEKGYKVFHGDTTDNLALSQEYIDDRLSMGEEYVRRFIRAQDWGAREGRIFDISPQSILDPDPGLLSRIHNSMRPHRAFDYGESAPWACLWYATDEKQNIYVYREAGAPGMLVSEQRDIIYRLSCEDGDGGKPPTYYSNVADPSIFNKTRGRTTDAVPSWCLAVGTKVLTSDLRHVPVETLSVGDVIAGFDEGNTSELFSEHKPKLAKDRCWKKSTVESVGIARLPSLRITLDDGTSIVCSREHKWLSNPTGQWRIWRKSEDLRVGQKLIRATEVWDTDNSNSAGYLAAAFDGEGFLTLKKKEGCWSTFRTGFSQCDNPMLDCVRHELHLRGFKPSDNQQTPKKGRVITTLTIGHRSETMRFLGSIRPKRLLPKFDLDILGRVHAIDRPVIVSIEDVGEQEVVTLGTSTKTLIAEGLMSHNSVRDEFLDGKLADPKTTILWAKANNDEAMTINRVREYLRPDPRHQSPFTGRFGAPRLYFIRRTETYPYGCKEVITDVQAARRVEVGTAPDGSKLFGDERDQTVRDHWLDALRYAIGSRPMLGPHAPDPEPEPGVIRLDDYFKDMEKENAKQAKEKIRTSGYFGRSGGYGY